MLEVFVTWERVKADVKTEKISNKKGRRKGILNLYYFIFKLIFNIVY